MTNDVQQAGQQTRNHMSRNRLELTWVGKDQRNAIEPRILLDDLPLSYHAPARKSSADQFENILIQGDNLLALKALEAEYTGKVKCVFIDPPYNTGSAFTHYDDGLEHSVWLSLMRDRLEIFRRLLSDDGSIWITIDDNECHYLKVLCDEIFGRGNFVANVVWEKKYAPQNNATWLSDSHDHVLVFAKNKIIWRPKKLGRSSEMDARYKNIDNDARGPWKPSDFTISLSGGQRGAQYAKTGVSNNIYEVATPSGRYLMPTKGRCWAASKEKFRELVEDGRIWFGPNGSNVPALKRFLSEVQDGIVAKTIWQRTECGDNQDAKREVLAFNDNDVFATPKPENLLCRILTISTNPGDLVLDSFAGSGTTGAVAHKMGRRWIMVEIGDHAVTHIVPRLKKVIDGTDLGGVSKTCQWKGGGGFRFKRLAPSLLRKDMRGRWIISTEYNPEMLAEAMCKHLGYRYEPNSSYWWMMGHASERDFLCVSTGALQQEDFDALSLEVGIERSLLVCCRAFMGKVTGYKNLTVKKIPQVILDRCEWGRDDYSLKINELPYQPAQEETGSFDLHALEPLDSEPLETKLQKHSKVGEKKSKANKKSAGESAQQDLFANKSK